MQFDDLPCIAHVISNLVRSIEVHENARNAFAISCHIYNVHAVLSKDETRAPTIQDALQCEWKKCKRRYWESNTQHNFPPHIRAIQSISSASNHMESTKKKDEVINLKSSLEYSPKLSSKNSATDLYIVQASVCKKPEGTP